MFACIYFEKDASLSVLNEKDRDLVIKTQFAVKEPVEMLWRDKPGKPKQTFYGIIVKVGDKEDVLIAHANLIHSRFIKGKVHPGQPVPEECFLFEDSGTVNKKRERILTEKLKQSKEQEEELSSPKKKKKKTLNERENQQQTTKDGDQNTPQEKKKEKNTEKKQSKAKKPQEQSSLVIGKEMLAMFSQFLPALSKVTADTEANKTDCEEQTVKQLSPEQETNVVQEPVKTLPSLSKVTADAEANKTNCEKKTVQQLSLEQEINVVQKPVKTLQALSKVTADTVADKTNCEEKTVQQLSPEQKTNVVQEPVKTLECNQLQEMGQQRTDKQMLQDQTERDIQQIPKPSQNTWTACREAYDLIYQSPDIIEKPAQQPTTVPASVLRTLKGLCDPEFVSFVKTLTDHLQNDHRCAHPCFQFPSVAVEEMDSTNSYIELMNNALPLTSTPLKSTSCDFAASQPVLPKSCSSTAEPVVSPKPMTSFNLSSKKLIKHAESKPKVVTKLRRSPRKRQSTVKSTKPTNPKDMVKLLETSDVMIDRADKLEAIRMAKKPKNTGKEGYALMYNLLDKVFTLEELATSKGQGIGKRHQDHNDSRSVLDPERMQVLKDFVSIWHSKNYPEKKNVSLNLNKAVTERISYARKKYTDTEGCFTPEEF